MTSLLALGLQPSLMVWTLEPWVMQAVSLTFDLAGPAQMAIPEDTFMLSLQLWCISGQYMGEGTPEQMWP